LSSNNSHSTTAEAAATTAQTSTATAQVLPVILPQDRVHLLRSCQRLHLLFSYSSSLAHTFVKMLCLRRKASQRWLRDRKYAEDMQSRRDCWTWHQFRYLMLPLIYHPTALQIFHQIYPQTAQQASYSILQHLMQYYCQHLRLTKSTLLLLIFLRP
jgi:hypothetical protein